MYVLYFVYSIDKWISLITDIRTIELRTIIWAAHLPTYNTTFM